MSQLSLQAGFMLFFFFFFLGSKASLLVQYLVEFSKYRFCRKQRNHCLPNMHVLYVRFER